MLERADCRFGATVGADAAPAAPSWDRPGLTRDDPGIAAHGCAEEPAGRKSCDGPMGAGTMFVGASRNSNSWEEQGESAAAKGNEVSSKTTWREMMMRLEATSRHRYPLWWGE